MFNYDNLIKKANVLYDHIFQLADVTNSFFDDKLWRHVEITDLYRGVAIDEPTPALELDSRCWTTEIQIADEFANRAAKDHPNKFILQLESAIGVSIPDEFESLVNELEAIDADDLSDVPQATRVGLARALDNMHEALDLAMSESEFVVITPLSPITVG